jgi:hypothetical protein
VKRFVIIVELNIMNKKTTTGAAKPTRPNTVGRYGGAAVNH